MVDVSIKWGAGEGGVNQNLGLVYGLGPLGISSYIGINPSNNTINMNGQLVVGAWSVKVSYDDSSGFTIAGGQGAIFGLGGGVSEFAGVQFSFPSLQVHGKLALMEL